MAEITVKDVLELTYERINERGWWGMDAEGNIRYSHAQHSGCECVAMHIDYALAELGALASTRKALRQEAAQAILDVVRVPETASAETDPWWKLTRGNDPWWKLTRWNDVPTRHVATVKRAIKRAIAKVA